MKKAFFALCFSFVCAATLADPAPFIVAYGDPGQCMGACDAEYGICMGQCQGDGQCISQCDGSHGRCLANCN